MSPPALTRTSTHEKDLSTHRLLQFGGLMEVQLLPASLVTSRELVGAEIQNKVTDACIRQVIVEKLLFYHSKNDLENEVNHESLGTKGLVMRADGVAMMGGSSFAISTVPAGNGRSITPFGSTFSSPRSSFLFASAVT